MEGQCPHCMTGLVLDQTAEMEVDACPKCGGIWFDGGELGRLAQARPGLLAGLEHRHDPSLAATKPAPGLGGCLCPVCRVFMKEFEFPWAPGIRLDGCAQCRGIWADDGELSRIETHVARYRRQQAAGTPAAPAPSGQAGRVQAFRTLLSRPEQ
jgi:uncharacterized protein